MSSDLIKSPMNYVGGKFKLLPQILPLFPKEVDTFVDLFCGGLNVGVNVQANKVICNDVCRQVIEVYNGIKMVGTEEALKLVKGQVDKYNLTKENEEGYKSIRDYYNKGNTEWYIFYAMLTHSFNYQIRFNKKGEYNMPFGKNRSHFNPTLEKNFIKFSDAIQSMSIEFSSVDFSSFSIDSLTDKDFVYLDPPYLITCASYNENGGWNEEKEKALLSLCDALNAKGVKFALSNVTHHKGKENKLLTEWAEGYNVHTLNYGYSNSNYQSKNTENKTIEVLITNY